MVENKKSLIKRISIIIITILVIFSVISMTATVIIYDSIFARYNGEKIKIPTQLTEMVSIREEKEYLSGKNHLSGYLYRSNGENNKNALIIIAPGFHASADNYLWQIKSLLDYGWSVFAFNTTGSYNSEGESHVGFAQELYDIEATLKYIEKNNRFGYNDIILLGHSRGGYAACCALSLNEYDISAVITISGVNSSMEGVIGASTEYVGPLAYGNYGFLWLYQTMLFGSQTVNLEANEEISKSDVPVLIVHGSNDTEVPIDRYSIISHRDEIESDNVEYIICSESHQNGHVNLLFDKDGTANSKLMEEINNFLIRNVL